MFGNTFSLIVGVGLGIYIAQNYDVPDIKKLVDRSISFATSLEKSTRKDSDSKS